MRDIILTVGLIIGVILLIGGKKTQIYKYIKIVGILIIAVCLVMIMPDLISSFIHGFRDGLSAK